MFTESTADVERRRETMSEQIQTVAGFKVVAFKLEPTKSMVQKGRKMVAVDAVKVRLWIDRAGGAAPESTIWNAGRDCKDRLFTSTDAARRNTLRAFGYIMER
jgi:hypothetical protein